MKPTLPYEIEEQVVDNLHGDPIALQACSLTCSAWVPTARRHLFRTAALTSKRRCVRFLTVLESTADTEGGRYTSVGEYVQELHLPPFALDHIREGRVRYEMVCQIFRRLPNVTTLVLDHFDWPHFIIDHVIPGEHATNIRDALVSIFPFPRLQQLSIRNLSFVITDDILQFISCFPNLTALELVNLMDSHTRYEDDTPHTLIPCGKDICLQELVVYMGLNSTRCLCNLLESLLKPPFELRLRKLRWKTDDPDVTPGRDLLSMQEKVLTKLFYGARETLEEFSLNVQRDGQCPTDLCCNLLSLI